MLQPLFDAPPDLSEPLACTFQLHAHRFGLFGERDASDGFPIGSLKFTQPLFCRLVLTMDFRNHCATGSSTCLLSANIAAAYCLRSSLKNEDTGMIELKHGGRSNRRTRSRS